MYFSVRTEQGQNRINRGKNKWRHSKSLNSELGRGKACLCSYVHSSKGVPGSSECPDE
jgi:hypothetical protein